MVKLLFGYFQSLRSDTSSTAKRHWRTCGFNVMNHTVTGQSIVQALVTAGNSARSFEKGLESSLERRDNPAGMV